LPKRPTRGIKQPSKPSGAFRTANLYKCSPEDVDLGLVLENGKNGANSVNMKPSFYVLVVEDNPDVLDSLTLFVDALADAKIFTASGFLDAAAIIKEQPRIDLILCDVVFREEMNGIDVAELAVKLHPNVAVVLFSAEQKSDVEGLYGRYSFVRKPFGRDELNRHIDKAFLRLRPVDEQLEADR